MSFKDELVNDSLAVFLNDDEFAETVIYLKRDGTERPIKALVDRGDTGGRDESDHGVQKMRTVEVAPHATLGILPSEIDNGEAIVFSDNTGVEADTSDPDQKHMIGSVPEQDDGMLVFRFGPRLV